MDTQNKCLIEDLKRLKASSKEAVDNLNSFSSFKKYIHVERQVQEDLHKLLEQASKADKSQLILVCGGAGDGKSHQISYFNYSEPEIMKTFQKHNDATESYEPQKTSIDTLNDVLDAFSDEKLNQGRSTKLILAINLGALNNFIDSEYKIRFNKLRQYVIDKKILEASITNNVFDESSNFQFINFSDYHMYSLVKDGVKSDYILKLISKIVGQDEENEFYRTYRENCKSCSSQYKCPVKANFEFIMIPSVQLAIINLIIESIIKQKLIVTTRSLLNFIYDILIDNRIDKLTFIEAGEKIKNLSFPDYLRYLTPNIIFEHKELSNIFEAVQSMDPVNLRNQKLDEVVIKLNTVDDISQVFKDFIRLHTEGYLYDTISSSEILNSEIQKSKELRKELITSFIRFYRFVPQKSDINLKDPLYENYIRNLYFWNKGLKSELSDLYDDITTGVHRWNGESEQGMISLFIGRNQLHYRISEVLDIVPYLDGLNTDDHEVLNKFSPYLIIGYKKANGTKNCVVNVDFALYKLLMRVKDGYRPNKRDKNNYINFVEFVDKIIDMGNQDKELFFKDNQGFGRSYKLVYKKEFGKYSFMEM